MVWLFELFAAAPLVKRKFEGQDNIPAAADNAADIAQQRRRRRRHHPRLRRRPSRHPAGQGRIPGAYSGQQPCGQGRQGGEASRGW